MPSGIDLGLKSTVIPGRTEGANPESRATDTEFIAPWIPGSSLRNAPE
jgi:hypothetical protein